MKVESPWKALASIAWMQLRGLWMVKKAIRFGYRMGPVPIPQKWGGGMSEGGEDQVHFGANFAPWDNYHDRKSHGVDGRDGFAKDGTPLERERIKNRAARIYYWAALRNRASNWGKLEYGVEDKDVRIISYEYDLKLPGGGRVTGKADGPGSRVPWPSDRRGVTGYTKAIGETTDGRLLPITYRVIKWPFINKCLRYNLGWALWEADADTGDTKRDWCGVKFNLNPWKKFGESL